MKKVLLLLFAVTITLGLKSQIIGGVPKAEYDALVALFNSTDGNNWTNKTNWLSDKPVKDWYGVYLDAFGNVSTLSLLSNNLKGSIPDEFINLTKLKNVYLSGNFICDLPDLSSIQYTNFYIGSNCLDFADLTKGKIRAYTFDYSNQKSVYTIREATQTNVKLTIPNHVSGNTYQWYRGNTLDGTSTTYIFTINVSWGSYYYYCEIKNSNFPNLTLGIVSEYVGDFYYANYTASDNGTIIGSTSQIIYHWGNGSEVEAVANTGYHFVAWSDGLTSSKRTELNVTRHLYIDAIFAINAYSLTYTAGANGTISGTASQTVNHGASGSEVEAVANTGYHFVAWSDGLTSAKRTDGNVTGNLSVSAEFAINTNVNENLEVDFKIYPNPFNDKITVTNAENISSYKIINLLGQVIISEFTTKQAFINIHCSNIMPGSYLLLLKTIEGKIYSNKIIKI